jgi:serine/threonine protein kinase
VESLLGAYDEAARLGERSPIAALPASAVASLGDRLHRGSSLGPYEILSKVGEGGMGEVYRARDTRLRRSVAIKVLRAEFAADPGRLSRFEREARVTAALNHPNILAIYDIDFGGHLPYLVTEWLEGETLRSAATGTRLSAARAIDYCAQVARALAAAHDQGILHRDLKPENLFLTRDGRIKILDFGLAKLIEADTSAAVDTTEAGRVLGTAAYMSPEQARGDAVDARTDIFSLGVILYELISGRRAFTGDTPADVLSAVIKDDPPPLSEGEINTPPGVDRIVRRCLEKDRDLRFRTAHDLAFALEGLSLSHSDVRPKPPARSRWLTSGIAAIALASLAFGGGWFVESRRDAAPPPLFTQLTYRRGIVTGARFAPDGQTVVYSAAWDALPERVFTTRIGERESRDLGIEGSLWNISRSGALAVKTGQRPNLVHGPGMLATLSLSGGAPRELLENVAAAGWSPDGESLAVAREIGGHAVIEYPMGRVLYRAHGGITAVCVLPDSTVALFEDDPDSGNTISLVDRNGRHRVLSAGWVGLGRAVAWSPATNEVVFSGWRGSGDTAIYAVTTSGRLRLVARVPVDIALQDVDARGRILLTRNVQRDGVVALVPGDTQERDLSWLDFSTATDLSADGRLILLGDWGGDLAVAGGGIAVRTTDGGPIIDLGRGQPLALSADGRRVLALPSQTDLFGDRLLVIPVGAGERRELRHASMSRIFDGGWFPDGRRVVVVAGEDQEKARLYIWDAEGSGAPHPVSGEGAFSRPRVSPDGAWVATITDPASLSLYPVAGGTPRVVPGIQADDGLLGWSTDGKSLFVRRGSGPRGVALVERLEIATGRRSRWKELHPAERAGVLGISTIRMTPDGNSYAYTFSSALGTLYLAQGLK